MTRSALRLTTAALLAGSLATALPAQMAPEGDPSPGLLDLITPDAIATALFNLGITVVRTQMEVSYDYLTSDITRGSFALAGLTVRPNLYYDRAGQCEITVERATFTQSGGALGFALPIGVTAGSVNFIGVEASAACLDPEISDMARAVGLRRFSLDQAKFDLTYDVASGEITGAMTLAVDGVAQLDMRAQGTYVTVPTDFFYSEPAVRLTEAVVTLKDRGGWNLVSTILPGEMRDPEVIREIGTEVLVDALTQGIEPLGATDRLFIDQLMNQVAAYVADPGEITIEANLPASGVIVSEDAFESPLDLIRTLALVPRTAPLARSEILSVSDVEAAREAGPAGQLELARAMLGGDGVPRSAAAALAIAESLTDDAAVGAAASLLVAQATLEDDPARAYEAAIAAAAEGEDGAVALLDAAEARLTTGVVLSLQPGMPEGAGAGPLPALTAILATGSDDPRTLRQAALDRLYGIDAPRSYAQAYYFAILAEAAGDIAATSLTEEIAARFRLRGTQAAAAWAEARSAAERQAFADWVAEDLPARYTRN